MTSSYKSALLCGLVFPGLGYLRLKMYLRAFLSIVPASICLGGLVQLSMVRSQALMDLLIAGKVAPNMPAMLNALQEISDISMGWQDYAGYGFMLFWGISVFDAYQIERKS